MSPSDLSAADAPFDELDEDESVCADGYPEHDEQLFDERDGIRVYHCRRCGAEIVEEDEHA